MASLAATVVLCTMPLRDSAGAGEGLVCDGGDSACGSVSLLVVYQSGAPWPVSYLLDNAYVYMSVSENATHRRFTDP